MNDMMSSEFHSDDFLCFCTEQSGLSSSVSQTVTEAFIKRDVRGEFVASNFQNAENIFVKLKTFQRDFDP